MSETFQRARSDEQRELRRASILSTASAMLREAPVSDLTLNELARRAGMAKSNVFRYFESREAVLLDLLASELDQWLTAVRAASERHGTAGVDQRRTHLVAALVDTLTQRPVVCDLLSAQASVLERNVSPAVAATYKRTMISDLHELADIARGRLPELDTDAAREFAATVLMMSGAVWTHSQPSAAMKTAYEHDPELASMAMEFSPTLSRMLDVSLMGLLSERLA
ncbi:TetR family transcriptional regulator [Nocardia sp. NPDC004340]